jgi:Caspase domain
MKLNYRSPGFAWFFSLILILLLTQPVSGQQNSSVPTIKLISPSIADSLNNSGLVTLSAEITTSAPLISFIVYNNEKIAGTEATIKPQKKENNKYVFESFIPINSGLNTLYLEAKNAYGTGISEKRVIRSQSEPFISWTSPVSPSTIVESAEMKIKAEIRSDLDPQNVIITFNGKALAIDKSELVHIDNNTYSLEKTLQLNQGKNNLFISAENIKGKTKSALRIINFGSGPVITLVSPSPSDTLNNSGLATLRAEIKSSGPLISFRVYCNDAVAINESTAKPQQTENNKYLIECFLPLKAGLNTIYVEAKNSLGTTVSEQRFITSQPEPFVIWIFPESSVSTSDNALINIKAEIKSDFDLKNISLNLNGVSVGGEKNEISQQNKNTYTIEKTIQLNQGKNIVFISAENIKGKTKSLTCTLNFGSSPVITIKNPLSSDSLNNSGIITFDAEIISNTPLQTLRIFDNTEIAVAEATAKVMEKDKNRYLVDCFVPLKGGLNAIYLEAKNSLGTSISDKRYIISQPEPFVIWTFPSITNWITESGMIRLKAQLRSDAGLKNIVINLNGNQIITEKGDITPQNNNTYILEKLIPLNKEKNTLYITADNAKGTTRSLTRYINIMGSAPSFTFISPSPEDSLNNSGITLINTEIKSSSALQAVRIYNNKNLASGENSIKPEQKDSITYIVKSLIPLQAGRNIFYVEARNSNGSATSQRRIVTCILEPIIKWISPSASATTTGSEAVKIKAEIKTGLYLLKTGISVNGIMVPLEKENITPSDNGTYILEKTITLNNGTNTIFLKAENAKGSVISSSYSINYIPETRSVIKWILPVDANSDTYSSDYALSASIITRSKINKTSLFLNGSELNPGSDLQMAKKNPEEYSYVNKLTLRPGTNTIDLSVMTDAGTVISEKRIIKYIVVTVPSLAWQSPASDRAIVNDSSVAISMAIRSAVNLDNIAVYVNGKEIDGAGLPKASRKENENFIFESKVSLQPGDNNIYISAKNTVGTAKSETRIIKYIVPEVTQLKSETVPVKSEITLSKPEAPVVTWVSPSVPSTNINLNSARIRVKIKSSDKIQSLLIYVNGTASEEVNQMIPSGSPDEYLIEKPISLQPEENVLYIVATNAVGTTKSDLRYLTNPPTTPPVITWAIPSANAIVNSELVVVEACIKSATDLKSAQIFVNGVQQANETTFQPAQQGECNFRLTKPVILKEGDNSVIIIATNFAGSKNSDPRLIRYQTAVIVEKRLALVFGNADYSSGALKNPVNDANLMEATLKSLGFDVIKKINSTKAEMESAIREFSEKLPAYNVALFYYAGHGVQVNGQNYLIPTDAVLNKQTDCQWEAIEVNKITQQFEQVPENTNIIILDACRNNPFRSWARGPAQGFKALGTVRGTFIAYATSEGSTAADGAGLNGVYTEELVKQMGIPQPIESVFKKTRKGVMERSNNQQIPTEWSYLTGDFYFKK